MSLTLILPRRPPPGCFISVITTHHPACYIFFSPGLRCSYGNAVKNVTKGVDPKGLYDTSSTQLGQSKGLRQNYRWGLYSESLIDLPLPIS